MKLYYILIWEWCCRKYIVEFDMGAYCPFFLCIIYFGSGTTLATNGTNKITYFEGGDPQYK